MANINPTIRVTTGNIATVNDSAPGGASLDGRGRAPGQLGQIFELSEVEAQKMSSALHGGKYQYVKFLSTSSASNARGQVVIWSDNDDFVVTPDVSDALIGKKAGVTLFAVTKGNYGFIQVSGYTTVLCKASVTGTTAGQLAVAVSDSSVGTVDSLADATAVTDLVLKGKIGTFVEAAANGGLKLIQMDDLSAASA